jgi:hypothetical protein
MINDWQYWSSKHQESGLKYEIAVHMKLDEIIWVRGGVVGSVHDLTIARECLVHVMSNNENALADSGYQGDNHFVTPHKGLNLAPEQINFNSILQRHRCRVERVNKHIKIFKAVRLPWRHNLEKHAIDFMVVCNLTNINLLCHPLKKKHILQ